MPYSARQRKGPGAQAARPSGGRLSKQDNRRISLSKNLALFAVSIGALSVVVYLLPCPIDPVAVSFPNPPALTGPLAPNKLLQEADRLLQGKVIGPEALEYHDGAIYTGTADGMVFRIEGDQVTTVARLGSPPCGLQKDEHTCGRPLGMKFHTDGYLYVLDAYLGLFRVNVETGSTLRLLSAADPIGGKPPKFLNDLDIDVDGVVYFTDSSYKWQRRENRYAVLERTCTARALRFDPKTGQKSVIIDGLCFANGIQLSPDQDFLLVAETTHARIQKYYLKGERKGQVEIFADNLPGLVDNISPRKAGGYWVSMAAVRKQPLALLDVIAARPWMSTLFTKLVNPEHLLKVLPSHGLVVALDNEGGIVESLHDTTGRNIASVSSVLDTGGHLYFGSYYAGFLGRLSMPSASDAKR